MVGLVVIRGEAQEVGDEEKDVKEAEDANVVLAVAKRRAATVGSSSILAVGLSGDEVKHTGADSEHRGNHDPIGVLADIRATRDESVGNNPNVEEDEEVVEEKADTESNGRALLGGLADQGHGDSHEVGGQNQGAIIAEPLLIQSKHGSTNASNTVGSPVGNHARPEDANE